MALTKTDLELIKQTLEPNFRAINNRFDGIDGRLDGVDAQLDGVEGRLGGVEGRLDKIEASIGGVRLEVETLAKATKKQFDAVFVELGDIKEDLAVVKDIVKDHSFRIARLEHRAA